MKRPRTTPSTQDKINKARDKLHLANTAYTNQPTAEAKVSVQKARETLQTAYDIATAEELQEKINKVSVLHTTHQHSTAWKKIDKITGRKDKPMLTVPGGTAQKRKEGW